MKQLVVSCHPNPESFNTALRRTLEDELRRLEQQVIVRDLFQMGFDPVRTLDEMRGESRQGIPQAVLIEQKHIAWADILTLVFPIWWAGMPAQLKGYLDRVLACGFAYVLDADGYRGLLEKKGLMIINTTGTPFNDLKHTGMLESMNQTIEGSFRFCGMHILGHTYFTGIPFTSLSDRQRMLQDVCTIARSLSTISLEDVTS